MGIFETRRVCKPQSIRPPEHKMEECRTEKWVVNNAIAGNSFHFCIIVKCKGPGVPVGKYLPVRMREPISHMKGDRGSGGERVIQLFKIANRYHSIYNIYTCYMLLHTQFNGDSYHQIFSCLFFSQWQVCVFLFESFCCCSFGRLSSTCSVKSCSHNSLNSRYTAEWVIVFTSLCHLCRQTGVGESGICPMQERKEKVCGR